MFLNLAKLLCYLCPIMNLSPAQAKLGWQWNNRSQQNLVIDHPSHPIYLSGKMYEGQDVDIWGAKSLLRWWTSSCAEQVTFAPAASETLQVYWPLSSAEQVGSSRVKWFSFATICRVMVFLHDFSTNNLSTLFWMFSVFIFELWVLWHFHFHHQQLKPVH